MQAAAIQAMRDKIGALGLEGWEMISYVVRAADRRSRSCLAERAWPTPNRLGRSLVGGSKSKDCGVTASNGAPCLFGSGSRLALACSSWSLCSSASRSAPFSGALAKAFRSCTRRRIGRWRRLRERSEMPSWSQERQRRSRIASFAFGSRECWVAAVGSEAKKEAGAQRTLRGWPPPRFQTPGAHQPLASIHALKSG